MLPPIEEFAKIVTFTHRGWTTGGLISLLREAADYLEELKKKEVIDDSEHLADLNLHYYGNGSNEPPNADLTELKLYFYSEEQIAPAQN